MDILISSNLERLLFLLSGMDDALVREWMGSLSNDGAYNVNDEVFAKLQYRPDDEEPTTKPTTGTTGSTEPTEDIPDDDVPSGSTDDEDAFVAEKLFIRDKKGRLVTEDIRYDEQLDIESVDEPADRINAVLVSDIFGRTVIKYDTINI